MPKPDSHDEPIEPIMPSLHDGSHRGASRNEHRCCHGHCPGDCHWCEQAADLRYEQDRQWLT